MADQGYTPRTRTARPAPLRYVDPSTLHGSKSARFLDQIRRDMDIRGALMRNRLRNEEILSLVYDGQGSMVGGAPKSTNLRTHVLNLPYRYTRWLEAKATSKRLSVKVNRNAGAGQKPGGVGDETIGMWRGIALERIAYEAGYQNEMRAVIREVCPRGSSVLKIGYHKQAISAAEAAEAGKDAQSVAADVLQYGDVEAKAGQGHAEVAEGLLNQASDPMAQAVLGSQGTNALLARRQSHVEAEYAEETDMAPISDSRMTRRRLWMKKLRLGEDCGFDPTASDVEDARWWWERLTWTVAEVKASGLFTDEFKAVVEGFDARNVSGVAEGGKTPSTDSMGSDARQAMTEDVLEEDERIVEWFQIWCRKPHMKSGGLVYRVCAEMPEAFIGADTSNPNVDNDGFGEIPGFYPFYDFTPIKSSLNTPEATSGIPPIGVGMPQFEQIAEGNRLVHESAIRHSFRIYEIDEALADDTKLKDALLTGKDGYAYYRKPAMTGIDGKPRPGITPIQFTGNTTEIERYVNLMQTQWVIVQGMPPAILQGVGTAETLGQEQQGIAAGERESGTVVDYLQERMADVLTGLQGLARGSYDDEDWHLRLGAEGAAAMKAWQTGTSDEGDRIEVTFGQVAQAMETVERKQLMEAITLEQAIIEPVTGLPKYDIEPLVEEMHRRLGLGKPTLNQGTMQQLQLLAMQGLMAQQAMAGASPTSGTTSQKNGPSGGPNPAEGSGPTQGNIQAGATRGTLPMEIPPAMGGTQTQ